jgi:hypothetical protein
VKLSQLPLLGDWKGMMMATFEMYDDYYVLDISNSSFML